MTMKWMIASVATALVLTGTGMIACVMAEETPPRTTVVWISLDGFRADYLERADTPALDRLIREGAFTRDLVPVFPSLTFPSHVSQATGVMPAEHGVTANSFFDAATGDLWRYPHLASLLQAEPIWLTAARQGVRTAVLDWPLSHAQAGEVRTDYHGEFYNPRLSDQERLLQLIEVWRDDTGGDGGEPLRLLMGYAVATDSPGHRYGPDAPEMVPHIEAADALVHWFVEEVQLLWRRTAREGDTLWFFITSDHGMSEVRNVAHPARLLGVEGREDIRIVTGGNIANVFVDQIEPESARQEAIEAMIAAIGEHEAASVWRREDLPERWGYDHPTRTGDLVVVLDMGYTFSFRTPGPGVFAPIDAVGTPRGMHGYDPKDDPDMSSLAVFWRYPQPLGGVEIDRVHALQLHATVAGLLGIEPAEAAANEPLELQAVPVSR
jgi:hypothetical protein